MISPVQFKVVHVRTTPSILSPLSGTVKSPGLNGLYYNLQCILYSSQFLLHSPTHTHPTESRRVECLLPGASETGQADHDTLHTAEAQVTSAE